MDMKNVMISITGLQSSGGKPDAVELLTSGEYCYENGEGRFTYMESELTGLKGTRTSFTVNPMGVVLSREGALTSSMTFEEGKKHFFLYETPYGSATMGVSTKRISNRLNENGGNIEIDYTIDLDHTIVGRNIFKISVRENGGKA